MQKFNFDVENIAKVTNYQSKTNCKDRGKLYLFWRNKENVFKLKCLPVKSVQLHFKENMPR